MELAGGDQVLCTRVAAHPQHDVVAAGFADGLVVLADIPSERILPVAAPGRGPVSALAWSEGRRRACLRNRDRLCRLGRSQQTIRTLRMEMITTRGLRMPKLGLGTWRMKGDECREAVERALSLGYRHLDTAEMYGNEEAVGAALAGARLPRDDVHVTTKVWFDHLAPAALRQALEGSLAKLQTDHVDLYMIHWPSPDMDLAAALQTLTRLQDEGLVRAIGVCNFTVALLRQAVEQFRCADCGQPDRIPRITQPGAGSGLRARP